MNMTAMEVDRATMVMMPTVTSSVRERKKAMPMIVPDNTIAGHISPGVSLASPTGTVTPGPGYDVRGRTRRGMRRPEAIRRLP